MRDCLIALPPGSRRTSISRFENENRSCRPALETLLSLPRSEQANRGAQQLEQTFGTSPPLRQTTGGSPPMLLSASNDAPSLDGLAPFCLPRRCPTCHRTGLFRLCRRPWDCPHAQTSAVAKLSTARSGTGTQLL